MTQQATHQTRLVIVIDVQALANSRLFPTQETLVVLFNQHGSILFWLQPKLRSDL
jgi:hypothetical protein